MSEKELKPGKPSPSLAPAYCAIYPDMAVLVRKHGYALSIHGSLRRDFDLVCIPWADRISTPDEVVDSIVKEFGFTRDKYPTKKKHGRICYTIHISWGECRFDLSFVLQPDTPPDTEIVPNGTVDVLEKISDNLDFVLANANHYDAKSLIRINADHLEMILDILTRHRAAQQESETLGEQSREDGKR